VSYSLSQSKYDEFVICWYMPLNVPVPEPVTAGS